ncbi:FAD-dependent monooxygenase [Sphingomonas sp. AX6]|uniref:FAD-dependent monooxygenase n=1 Tax=Sphingomonas sp. AX6 TaxID=2653171 RepID=UPI0012F20C0F|nr:FAD-dependent monooxygenase [Sphingomonas sp. AX6]VXC99061.1 putative Aurachin C monooxygenase/isomerase [Sphingomonas sp. AX6]
MPTALVIGAGIGGLAAAIGLQNAGYHVAVHERAADLKPLGAGLSLWSNAVQALRALNAAARIETEAEPIETMVLATRQGRALLGPRRVTSAEGVSAYLVTRALLQSALQAALGGDAIHLDSELVDVAQDDERATARFADGSTASADLIVIANGIWSPQATALIGNAPRHCGYGGVFALSDPVDHPQSARRVAEYWGDRERFGLCDIGGGRRYWFYIVDQRPGAAAIGHDDCLARASDGWPDGIVQTVAATTADRLIAFDCHARAAPRRLGVGRILCVGDAAHAMEPNLGQGACQAPEDAVALSVAAQRESPEHVVSAVEAMRLKRVRSFVIQSRRGRYGTHAPVMVQHWVRATLSAIPAAIHDRAIGSAHLMPDYR